MFETERLLFRQFTMDDLAKLVEMRSPAEVNQYLGGTRLQNPEAIEKRLQFYIGCYGKYGFGMNAMIWKETGEMIGWSGLQPLDGTDEIEVGYGMIKEFWGKGIGFEAAQAWLNFGFNVKGLERIVAVAYPENKGSWRIMEKCGMKYEKTAPHYGENCVFYAISQEEFLKNKLL
ncbi:MAG TPA: GNAT family N-acetyltransferase [Pyrinomonadaceae bacterium]|nr:GNAT family N-acetyltransferase [Pyrinomonadaceae bacterium]